MHFEKNPIQEFQVGYQAGGRKLEVKSGRRQFTRGNPQKISFGVWKFMLVLLKKRLLLVPASL